MCGFTHGFCILLCRSSQKNFFSIQVRQFSVQNHTIMFHFPHNKSRNRYSIWWPCSIFLTILHNLMFTALKLSYLCSLRASKCHLAIELCACKSPCMVYLLVPYYPSRCYVRQCPRDCLDGPPDVWWAEALAYPVLQWEERTNS